MVKILLLVMLLSSLVYSENDDYKQGFNDGYKQAMSQKTTKPSYEIKQDTKPSYEFKQYTKTRNYRKGYLQGIKQAESDGLTNGFCLGAGLGCIGSGIALVYDPNPPLIYGDEDKLKGFNDGYTKKKKGYNVIGSFVGIGFLTLSIIIFNLTTSTS